MKCAVGCVTQKRPNLELFFSQKKPDADDKVKNINAAQPNQLSTHIMRSGG
jgi:hypothetical protein